MRKSSYFAAHFLQRIFLVKQVCTFLPLALGFRAAVRCKTGNINHAATLFSPIRVFFPLSLSLSISARVLSIRPSLPLRRPFLSRGSEDLAAAAALALLSPHLILASLGDGKKCSARGGGERERKEILCARGLNDISHARQCFVTIFARIYL